MITRVFGINSLGSNITNLAPARGDNEDQRFIVVYCPARCDGSQSAKAPGPLDWSRMKRYTQFYSQFKHVFDQTSPGKAGIQDCSSIHFRCSARFADSDICDQN